MCLNSVSLVSVMDFPVMGLEIVGLGLFWSSILGALEVGTGVAVFKFPWKGSSPI